jgi:hypothetical protein
MGRLGLDQPAADRVAGELHPVVHAKLLEDVGPVALDGLGADDERVGDLLAQQSLSRSGCSHKCGPPMPARLD